MKAEMAATQNAAATTRLIAELPFGALDVSDPAGLDRLINRPENIASKLAPDRVANIAKPPRDPDKVNQRK